MPSGGLAPSDLPDSNRREKDLSNSNHDSISLNDMKGSVRFLKEVLRPAGNVHIFNGVLELGAWFQKWINELEQAEALEEEDGTDAITKQEVFHDVYLVPLSYDWEPGNYHKDLQTRQRAHTGTLEMAVHLL